MIKKPETAVETEYDINFNVKKNHFVISIVLNFSNYMKPSASWAAILTGILTGKVEK